MICLSCLLLISAIFCRPDQATKFENPAADDGAVKSKVILQHQETEKKQEKRSIRKTALLRGSRIMECEILYPDGQYVEHIITWRKQGIEVPIFIQFNGYPPHVDAGFQERLRLVEKATIEISDIRESDEGWYECSIVFLDGAEETSSNGTWIHLTVHSPPVLKGQWSSDLLLKDGETLHIPCDGTGNPPPSKAWFKNGKELVITERTLVTNSSLVVRNVSRSDGGVYTCNMKNVAGQTVHVARVIIEGNVYIISPLKNVTAFEGSSIRFNCEADGYPNNITYRWFHDGEHLDLHDSLLMMRVSIHSNGSLVINDTTREDAGWYTCSPTNGLSEPPRADSYLNITFLPQVLGLPVQAYLARGLTGHLDCPVHANPPVTLVVWSKNDRTLDLLWSSRMRVNRNGTLLLFDVQSSDEGRYSCTPYSPVGSGHKSSPVHVLVRESPYFSVRPTNIYQRQPLQSVTMPCVADGDPLPSVTWHRPGRSDSLSKSTLDGSNLTIHNIDSTDQGTYECIAVSLVSTVVTSALLLVELSVLHSAYNLTVEASLFSVSAAWMPAYDGGNSLEHFLRYREAANVPNDWHMIQITPEDATSITIYNLRPNTCYQFAILAKSLLNELLSEVVNATTLEVTTSRSAEMNESIPMPNIAHRPNDQFKHLRGGKPQPPVNVTVMKLTNGSLLITWQPPPIGQQPVEDYIIQYRTVGRWIQFPNKILNRTSHIWTTVSKTGTYQFRVLTSIRDLTSQPSHTVTVHALDHRSSSNLSSLTYSSEMLIASSVGSALFFLLAAMLAVLFVKTLRTKKRQETQYINVKYFGPNLSNTSNSMPMQNSLPQANNEQTDNLESTPCEDNNHRLATTQTNYLKAKVHETPI